MPKALTAKKRLAAFISDAARVEPEYFILRNGHQWLALSTKNWLDALGNEVSESTFRRVISKPPFVRRVFTVREDETPLTEGDYLERVLCLRLGGDEIATADRAKALASIWRRHFYKDRPKGCRFGGYVENVGKELGGTWSPPSVWPDMFAALMKLADLWGSDAPAVFEHVLGRWADFMACAGADRKLDYPSVRTVLRYQVEARAMWKQHRKAVATVRKMAQDA